MQIGNSKETELPIIKVDSDRETKKNCNTKGNTEREFSLKVETEQEFSTLKVGDSEVEDNSAQNSPRDLKREVVRRTSSARGILIDSAKVVNRRSFSAQRLGSRDVRDQSNDIRSVSAHRLDSKLKKNFSSSREDSDSEAEDRVSSACSIRPGTPIVTLRTKLAYQDSKGKIYEL